MIKSFTVTNHLGESITLELTRPEKSGFIVLPNTTGLGPTTASINTTKAAMTDGTTYNSSVMNERNIVLALQFYQTGNESIEDIRHKSYRYFPVNTKVKIRVETDNRTTETEGIIESNEPTIFSANEGCSISIICPDPFWHSAKTNETVFSGVLPVFEFPFENPSLTEPLLEMGVLKNMTENTVYYAGDANVGMIIIMHALSEVKNLVIYNSTTRERMKIDTDKIAEKTGSGIIAGDTITIETTRNNKSITLLRDGVETNIFNCLNKDSDWFTLVRGDNIFGYTAETGASNLQFLILNKILYKGV